MFPSTDGKSHLDIAGVFDFIALGWLWLVMSIIRSARRDRACADIKTAKCRTAAGVNPTFTTHAITLRAVDHVLANWPA
jgi:hypothetical protein